MLLSAVRTSWMFCKYTALFTNWATVWMNTSVEFKITYIWKNLVYSLVDSLIKKTSLYSLRKQLSTILVFVNKSSKVNMTDELKNQGGKLLFVAAVVLIVCETYIILLWLCTYHLRDIYCERYNGINFGITLININLPLKWYW